MARCITENFKKAAGEADLGWAQEGQSQCLKDLVADLSSASTKAVPSGMGSDGLAFQEEGLMVRAKEGRAPKSSMLIQR